jgi:microcin C transport system permease protein
MSLFAPSPLACRRWAAFRRNRRGWCSLWLFLAVLGVALAAELVANDRPLLVRYQEKFYVPLVTDIPETVFGGDLLTAADYHDPFVQRRIGDNGWMLWPLIPWSYRTIDTALERPVPAPPSTRHWLGTDDQGRDVLARVIYGVRLSLVFALVLTALSSAVGILAGAVQGYFGGLVDLLLQRFIEIWSGLPTLFVLIILSSMVTPNIWWLLGIMLLFSWMALVAVVRAEFLRVRNFDYVRAARALGMGDVRIMLRHILPNAMVAAITFMPFVLNGAVVTLTALDFLGFGLPPGSPSLGELVRQGKDNLQAPWLGLTAFMTLTILLSLLIFIGEAVRDAFNPRKA